MNRGRTLRPKSVGCVNVFNLHIVVKNSLTAKYTTRDNIHMDVNPHTATKWLHRLVILLGIFGSLASLGSCVHQLQTVSSATAPNSTN